MFFNNASGFEEGYAKKDNLEIYYRDYGPVDGIPVLLVMGLGGQLTFWPPYMIKRLQDSGYRPIAYDNRDMGLSTRFKSNPTFMSNYLKYYLNIPIKSEYKLDDMANDKLLYDINKVCDLFKDIEGIEARLDENKSISLSNNNLSELQTLISKELDFYTLTPNVSSKSIINSHLELRYPDPILNSVLDKPFYHDKDDELIELLFHLMVFFYAKLIFCNYNYHRFVRPGGGGVGDGIGKELDIGVAFRRRWLRGI